MNRTMQKQIQTVLAAAMTWLACAAGAAVPSSWLAEIPNQPYSMPVRARVKLDGKVLTAANGGAGSCIAAFHNGELRGVAAFDDSDGYYFYNLTVRVASNTEKGYTFQFYNPATDTVTDCAETLDYTALGYGSFDSNFDLVPQILTPKSPEPTVVEPIVTITANDATATEGSTTDTGQFTITRKKADGTNSTSGTTTVNLKITGTATNGVDYTEITTTSKIASGKYSNTKTVKTLADSLTEGDETVVITILPGDGYSVGEQNTATVTIKDVAPAPVEEYTITTKASPSGSGTVTGAGTYAKGASVTLTATPKAGYKFVKWTKGTSTTSVSTANPYSFTASADAAYVANFETTVVEPIVTITANDPTAAEGSTTDTGQFTITRKKADGTNSTSGTTTVNLKITGTATNGVDYTEITTTSAIASGKYKNTKTVKTLADSLTEGDETVVITILPGDGYSVGGQNTATVTIKDSAPAPVEEYTITTKASPSGSGTVTGGGTYAKGAAVKLTATAGAGYKFVKWTKGTSTTSVSTANPYSFTASADATYVANFEATAAEPIVTITANDPTATEGSATDTGQFTISRRKASGANYTSGTTTVNLQITGTATNGVDYTEITTTSKIASGKYQNTKTVKTLADSLTEGDETVVITILPGDGYSVGEQNTATVTIRDDAPDTYTITTRVTPAGSGTVTGGGTYVKGKTATLTAKAGAGYTFVKWTKGTSTTSAGTDNPYTVTVSGDATYVANFELVAVPTVRHPADADGDNYISGGELLNYMAVARNAAVFGHEIVWDGRDVLSMARYSDGSAAASGELTRMVSSHVYGAGSTVTVMYTVSNPADVTAVFTGDVIPAGWTLENANGGVLADGVIRFFFNWPDIPDNFSYTLRAPQSGLKDSYVLADSGSDTAVVMTADSSVVPFAFSDTLSKGTSLNPDGSFHPADTTQDNHISGLEYLAYAGAAESIALSHVTYTWDGTDVLSLAPANGTRGGAAGVRLTRRLGTADYAAGSVITVTLDIEGASGMAALFIGEIIPAGWTVVNAAGGTLVNGVLKFAFEGPAIPAAVSYTIAAPSVGLKSGYAIRSTADTGCYARGVIALAAEDTLLGDPACGVTFDEWPLQEQFYAADGGVFSWPAIGGAGSYLLTVYDAAGAVVAATSVAGTSATIADLPDTASSWSVATDGMVSPEMALAPPAAVTGGYAAGNDVILSIGGDDGAVIACDVLFYSAAGGWSAMSVELQILDGAARLDLGQPAAGGYLCIRPQDAADYTEMFLE